MSGIAYYNGTIGKAEELSVPLLDRAMYFGDGCYEAALVIDGRPIDLSDHLNRFFNSLKLMRIDFNKSREELEGILLDMCSRVKEHCTMLYWQCSRGTAPRSHCFPPSEVKPNLLITVDTKQLPDTVGAAPMITLEDIRFRCCNIKTLNLFPNVMANQQAKEAGATEAILIRPDGFVTEGSHTNCFIIKDGVLKTHEDGCLVLPGITKLHILREARRLGIPVEEKAFTRDELFDADEVFISSSTLFLKRASSIDGRPCRMSDEKTFRALADAYSEHAGV